MRDKYKHGFHNAVNRYAVVDTDKNEVVRFFDDEKDAKDFAEYNNKQLKNRSK